MPIAHVSANLSVHDAKVKLITADPAGGTTTYGSFIDVPDMTGVQLEGETDVKTRRGDGTIRDRRLILTGATLTFTNTKLPLDVLAALQGGTVTDSGTTPNMKAVYKYGATSVANYVYFEAQCLDTDFTGGDAHLIMHKGKINNLIPIGFTDDDFQTYDWELGAVSRNSDGGMIEVHFNETAVAIA